MRRVLFRNKSVQSLELDDFSKFEAGASLVVALLRKPEFCLSVCLSVCLSACLSVCLSVCVSVCVCVCLSVCVSACACLSVCFQWQGRQQQLDEKFMY